LSDFSRLGINLLPLAHNGEWEGFDVNKFQTRAFVLLVLTVVLTCFESAHAWDDDPNFWQLTSGSSDEYLTCDVLEVDSQRRAVLVQISGRKVWFTVAPEARITRNGVPASLESLGPIGKGIFQEAYLLLDKRDLVIFLDAWYRAIPVQIVGVQRYPVEMVQVKLLNSAQETTCELAVNGTLSELIDASFLAAHENRIGLAVVSRDLKLRYYVPYRQ